MDIKVARTQKEIVDNFIVRGNVFIVGQDIDWAIEFDGLDDQSVLFNAYEDETIIGAARLYKNKVGRVATLPVHRRKGVASTLMVFIENYAKQAGMDTLILHAQLHVKNFYLNRGYIAEGPIFQEAEIDHVLMTKTL